MSAGIGGNNDETKSVKFASSSPTPARRKIGLFAVAGGNSGHHDDTNTISTIRSLMQYVK